MDADTSTPGSSTAYPHAVKFYENEESLGRTVGEFLAPGLRERLPAIVIATPEHRSLIANELRKRGLTVRELEAGGELQMLDADEMLARFMVGQTPEPNLFFDTIDALIDRACQGRPPCAVRVYGEMVDLLWKRANPNGAIELEILWNRVATHGQFSLLCSYAVANFYKQLASGPSMDSVCGHHSRVIADDQLF